MPKKNEEAIAEQNVQQPEAQQEQPQAPEQQAPAKGGKITLAAATREQLQEDALKYLADNPGSYILGAAGYNAEIGKYTINIKTKEK